MKKIIVTLLILTVIAGFVFAGGQKEVKAPEAVEMRIGDNLPDRTSGMGLVLETINQEFLEMHPDLSFEVESLPDQPWQEKVLVYASSNQLPDIFKYWSFPAFMEPLVENEYITPLNMDVMAAKGFIKGALENNVVNGKLYGIPVSADLWTIYYNKALFAKAGIAVPETVSDLFAAADKFREMGIAPVATNGMDAWPLIITYDALVQRYAGTFDVIGNALDRTGGFDEAPFLKAAELLQRMTTPETGIFQDDLMVADYGAARNLFGQERAAMYIMGSWEMGLATDENFSENFRNNVGIIKFPVVKGGKGSVNDLVAWYGGNMVASSGENSELAVEYLEYFADRFPQLAWELQATFPAQTVTPNDSDTQLAKGLIKIAADAVSTSGTPSLDRADGQFKDSYQRLISELCIGIITPEEFVKKLDKQAADAAARK